MNKEKHERGGSCLGARGGLPWSLSISLHRHSRRPSFSSANRSSVHDGMNFSLLWAALVDPSKMFSMALSLVSSPPSTLSQEASFYPPLDAISYITDSTYGTFGGIFNAPAEAASPTTSEAYNYCTMPHPHPDRYEPPSPVQNGSVEAQLVYVEYIQRHQRRTAYNILPGGEVGTASPWPHCAF